VSGEEARLVRKREDALDALPEVMCIAPRKVGPGGAAIRHEQRVMDEGRVTDDIGDEARVWPGENMIEPWRPPSWNASPSAKRWSHCDPSVGKLFDRL
jgi:hypothetical protein